MRDNDKLQREVESASTANYRNTKAQIVDYYQKTYGEKRWIRELALKETGLTSVPKRGTPEFKTYNTARRPYEGNRLTHEPQTRKAQASQAQHYQQLGKQLPPIDRTPKSETLNITVTGKQDNGYGGMRERTIEVTLTGKQAYDFVNNPSFDDIYDEYFDGEYEGEFDDGSSELEVTGVAIAA